MKDSKKKTSYYGVEDDSSGSGKKERREAVKIEPDGLSSSGRRNMMRSLRKANMRRYFNIYIVLGIALGIAIIYLLVVPAVRRKYKNDLASAVSTYNSDIAYKNMQIENLKDQNEKLSDALDDYASQTDALNKRILELEETVESIGDMDRTGEQTDEPAGTEGALDGDSADTAEVAEDANDGGDDADDDIAEQTASADNLTGISDYDLGMLIIEE